VAVCLSPNRSRVRALCGGPCSLRSRFLPAAPYQVTDDGKTIPVAAIGHRLAS
jgi:hypothetical protein